MIRAVAFDVGETLIKDDRGWAAWADWLGVNRHTLSALVGAVVAQGRDNADALRLVRPGIDIEVERAAMERAGRGEALDESDLYPDVRPSLAALRDMGVRVVVAGNQTCCLLYTSEMCIRDSAVAVSGEWGVAKPSHEFFARTVELAGVPAHEVLYVGDHPQNDVTPARAAGLRTAHLRRGPLGYLWAGSEEARAADWRIQDLAELVEVLRPQ